MHSLSLKKMRSYLSRSLAGSTKTRLINQNKLNGLLAEVEFRNHLATLGFSKRVSLGGWIARRTGPGVFGTETIAILPEILSDPGRISRMRLLPDPPRNLHTICSTFYQIGIKSYFAAATLPDEDSEDLIDWNLTRLGTPEDEPWQSLDDALSRYLAKRERRYQPLRHNSNVSRIPNQNVLEEFLKENLRVRIQREFKSEISDIDGILWGQEKTYPLEIKEKTVASDRSLGDFFGIDAGPFVKLAHYAARRGNLHSLFVVREIDDTTSRNLVAWWGITFDKLAQFASWTPQAGGTSMRGSASVVIKVPKSAFSPLDSNYLSLL